MIGLKTPSVKIPETRKYTAIYTQSVGRYGGCIVLFVRFEVKDGQSIKDAINEAGYEYQKKVAKASGRKEDLWDIDSAVTHIFDGHPNLEGEVFLNAHL